MNTYAVIMAGGSGERFWPYSRIKRPKQLLRLADDSLTMLEQAVQRVRSIIPPERVLVVTSAVLQQPIRDVLEIVPPENIIAEPAKRNTAPCLALAAAHILAREGGNDALMAVLTADHFIGNEEAFCNDVRLALTAAQQHGSLVTLGITPSRAETGYGYIECGGESDLAGVRHVRSFKEKPDAATAQEYVRHGGFVWNSGMFFWLVSTLHATMNKCLPQVGAAIDVMHRQLQHNSSSEVSETFSALPDISIDYGVMERAENVDVVTSSFSWDDIGSWDALLRLLPTDERGNVVIGDAVLVDCHNSIVVNVSATASVATAVGLHNAVYVITDDAVMVCPNDRSQDVKSIVHAIRAAGRTDLL